MNVSGGNSKEIFELFTNKLVFSVAKMKNQMKILTHLLIRRAFREKCIFTDYNERVFVLLSIWFISLSINLKLSIDIFIMSVRHVFADFRFIFVTCSCSRRDSTSLFSLFYKIILYIQGSRLRPFFESVRVKIWSGRTCVTHRGREQSRSSVYAEWARQHEREGACSNRAQRRIWFSN